MPKKNRAAPVPNAINSWQIDAAREMHQMTTNARVPRGATTAQQRPPSSNITPISSTVSERAAVRTTAAPKPPVQVPAHNHHGKCNNPRCAHCGAVIIPSPAASFPLSDTPSIQVGDWQIFTSRNPILNASEIDTFESILHIPVPEMIFGNNKVEVLNNATGFHLIFNSLDALKTVSLDPTDLIKVSYANDWFKSRQHRHQDNEEVVLEVFRPYDWTYTTNYLGTELQIPEPGFVRDDTFQIPTDKLTRRDPILFFDDITLFEDELADNGMSTLNIKIRVMPECMLILQRLFVRVDEVLVRVHDTRLYVDFADGLIVREYKTQQQEYATLLELTSRQSDPRKLLRDIQWCSGKLPLVRVQREYIKLKRAEA